MNWNIKKYITRDFEIEKNRFIIICLILLGILFFYNIKDVIFVTTDETVHYFRAQQTDAYEYIKNVAIAQGRFYMFFSLVLALVPYLIDSFLWYKIFSIGTVILSVFVLWKLLKKWLGINEAFLGVVCIFSFYEINLQHNLMIAYPFFLQLPLIFFMISIDAYLENLHEWNLKRSIMSAVCLFFSCMFNEAFVLTSVAYVLLTLMQEGFPNRKNFKSIFKQFASVGIGSLIYIVIYLTFKKLHPSIYSGNTVNFVDIKDSLKTLLTFVFGQFPLVTSSKMGDAVFDNVNIISIIVGVVTGICVYEIIVRLGKSEKKYNVKKICVFLIPSIICVCIPYALTEKYTQWVNWGTYSYIVSYYTFYGEILFIIMAISFLVRKSKRYQKVVCVLLAILLGGTACVISGTNQYYGDILTARGNEAENILDFLDSDTMQNIDSNSMVYHAEYYAINEEHVEDYLIRKYNVSTDWTTNVEELDFTKTVYYMGINEQKGFLCFGRIDDKYQSEQIVFYSDNSFYGKTIIMDSQSKLEKIRVNGLNEQLYTDTAIIPILDDTSCVTLDMSEPVDVRRMELVDETLSENSGIRIEWNENSYGEESDGSGKWRWLQNGGGFKINNNLSSSYKIKMQFNIRVENNFNGEDAVVWININGQQYEYETEYNSICVEETFLVPPGETIVEMSTDGKPVDAPGDPRALYMNIENFSYTVLDE